MAALAIGQATIFDVHDGEKGETGIQGPTGPAGQTLYTWLKYADSPTTGMSDSPTGKKYMGLAYNKTTATESSVYTDYSWSLIEGPQGSSGIQGPSGSNGESLYTWIKYGTTSTGGTISDSPTGKTYIGIAYNKTTATESLVTTDYEWSLIQGPAGPAGSQGIQGPAGPTGQSLFTWLKYADSPTTGMADTPTGKKYIGLAYNKTSATESSVYADYSWSLIEGPQGSTGIQGPSGSNGQTYYTWIKYGTSATGGTISDSPTGKTYIGIAYNKTTPTESAVATDYAWSLIQGPTGPTGPQGPPAATIANAVTTIDDEGITVKDGSFFLEDTLQADFKYSVVAAENLILDHSFEMVDIDFGTYNTTYWWADLVVPAEGFTPVPWKKYGSPKVSTGISLGSGLTSQAMFGAYAMAVRSTDYVYQITSDMAKANTTYSLSAFFKQHPKAVSGGTPVLEVYTTTDGVTKTLLASQTFPVVDAAGKVQRHKTTFTTPSGLTNSYLYIVLRSGNASWIDVDGVQLVEGLPTLYNPEDSLWKIMNNAYAAKRLTLKSLYVNGVADDGGVTVDADITVGGTIMTPSNKYAAAGGGINVRNSDLINLNCLYMSDISGSQEGIQWVKSTTPAAEWDTSYYDSFRVYNGTGFLNDVPIFTSDGGLIGDNILWEGGAFMSGTQTITPSKSMQSCPNGWLLAWSEYVSGAPANAGWQYTYIPKRFATLSSAGMWIDVYGNGATPAVKYMYFTNTTITGNARNSTAPQNQVVLRAVYGW